MQLSVTPGQACACLAGYSCECQGHPSASPVSPACDGGQPAGAVGARAEATALEDVAKVSGQV